MRDYIGRCFVECTKSADILANLRPKVYFKNYRTAVRFAYYWTKRNGYFCRIFEFHEPCVENEFIRGYDWIVSVRNGMDVASNIYTWQFRHDYWDDTERLLKESHG